jgi:F0F1-type ATP synthase delta subunit
MVEQTKPSALATNMNKVKKLISALNEAEFLKFISNLSISNNNKKKLLTQICKKTGLEEYQYIF